jgi:hypothetical protein
MVQAPSRTVPVIFVHDLQSAISAYWSAHSRREEQAAYHEMLLYGAVYGRLGWRGRFAAWLRRLALRFDP